VLVPLVDVGKDPMVYQYPIRVHVFPVIVFWSVTILSAIMVGGLTVRTRITPGPRRRGLQRRQGRAVQVDPIKPTLQAPGTKRLKLEFDELLSNFAFNFNLRRYTKAFVQGSHIAGNEPLDNNDAAAGTLATVAAGSAVVSDDRCWWG